MKIKIITALLVGLCCFSRAEAQVVLYTSTFNNSGGGGSATHPDFGNFTVDWSVGEMALVNTVNNGNLVLTQGMLQPALDFKTSIDLSDIKIGFYPNPTTSFSYLDITLTNQAGKLEGGIYNMIGQLVSPNSINVISSGRYRVNFDNLPAGMYMLNLKYSTQYSTDVRKQTYKVIKLH